MRPAALVPAYQAEQSIVAVVSELVRSWPEPDGVLVVDDGSTDRTAELARSAGAAVIAHRRNQGKGIALRTGLAALAEQGFDVAVTVDADGQHPPAEALRLHRACPDPAALVLGIRDLGRAGAPPANRWSNGFSNFAISGFALHRFHDTQCGLRRYPIRTTLALGVLSAGYGFEAEVLIRAAAAGVPIVELPVRVIYPPEQERISHFDSVRDPTRIVIRVVKTVLTLRLGWLAGRLPGRRPALPRR